MLMKERKLRKQENKKNLLKQKDQLKKIQIVEARINNLIKENKNLNKKVVVDRENINKKNIKHLQEENELVSFVEKVSKKVENIDTDIEKNKKQINKTLENKEKNLTEILKLQSSEYSKVASKLDKLEKETTSLEKQIKKQRKDLEFEINTKNITADYGLKVNQKADINILEAKEISIGETPGNKIIIHEDEISMPSNSFIKFGKTSISVKELGNMTKELKYLYKKCGNNLENCFFKKTDEVEKKVIHEISKVKRNIKKLR